MEAYSWKRIESKLKLSNDRMEQSEGCHSLCITTNSVIRMIRILEKGKIRGRKLVESVESFSGVDHSIRPATGL